MASGSPRARQPVDLRPARVAEADVAGHLVERLAGGVVDGLAQHPVAAVALHRDDHRVAARHQQERQRRVQVGLLQEGGVEVTLEVVDPDVGDAGAQRHGLGGADADEQRAGQAGPGAGGHGVEVGQLEARFDEGLGDDRVDEFEVGPAGDLRDDAAEAGVEVALAGHDRRQQVGAVLHDPDGGLVARRLDPEDLHRCTLTGAGPPPRSYPGRPPSMGSRSRPYSSAATSSAHMTRASSLVSA